ncbi:MAG TPA: class I SAM-dependent methyltransferase [Caulobacteraceae bacterium]|nr:class I SAM-dependent methyltransferase [Caulobacteraceae bacterium]
MRAISLAAAALALALSACTTTQAPPAPTIPGFLTAAVTDPARPATDRERDAERRPAELLAWAGVTPGMKIADLIPGGGYFTRIFARAVGPTGRVYAYVPDELTKLANRPPAVNAIAADPVYGNVRVIVRTLPNFSAPEKLDMVWTSLNYHDMHATFMGPVNVSAVNRAVFNALKPGGTYIVIDHAGNPGTGITQVNNLHRIDPAVVRREVEAAGFIFDGESTMLRNPGDARTLTVFDEQIRGSTDQFVYKFRKPRGAR